MANPSPVPSNRRARPLSIWLKGVKRPTIPLRRDPDPGVGHADLEELRELAVAQREAPARPRAGQAADGASRNASGLQRHLAALGGELHGVGEEVIHNLFHFARVGADRAEVRGGVHAESDMTCRGLLPDDRQAVREQRGGLHRLEIEGHLARLYLGEVQDVVDQREQMLPAAEDVADVPSLLVGQVAHQAILEHLGEADDGIQRGPQLVRHVGEERRLHAARLLQFDVLLLQRRLELRTLVLCLLARRVVGADQQVSDDGILRVAQRRHGEHHGEPAPVLADLRQLVNILDPARRLEDQRLEPRRDRCAELDVRGAAARAISSSGSERLSAGVILFMTSAAS